MYNIGRTSVFTRVGKPMISKPDLEEFWNIESIGVNDNPEAEDDKIAMDNFKDTLTFENNRY